MSHKLYVSIRESEVTTEMETRAVIDEQLRYMKFDAADIQTIEAELANINEAEWISSHSAQTKEGAISSSIIVPKEAGK